LDESKAKSIGEQFSIPSYTDMHQMMLSEKIDAVVVLTESGNHARNVVELAQYGKHIVVEKPMALTLADADAMIQACDKSGGMLFVVKQNRYSPPSQWMKDVVRDGTIGNVLMVQVNCYWNRDDRYYKKGGWKGSLDKDGGTLFTQFSHFIDIMYWVFGDIQNIKASFADFNHATSTEFEDSGVVNFEFAGGGLGSLNFSTSVWDTNMESSITVVGTKGSFKVGGQYMNEVEYCHIENYTMPELPPTNAPNDYGPFKGSAANHHYVIENVVNTLKGNDTITANALEGLKVVDIIERIYSSRDLSQLKK
jgi:predicted dehydrogenase